MDLAGDLTFGDEMLQKVHVSLVHRTGLLPRCRLTQSVAVQQHNYLWGQASNLMMVPSDCDNRDERFGWTGDSALTADEASVNFDLSSFCESQPLLLWCAGATLC